MIRSKHRIYWIIITIGYILLFMYLCLKYRAVLSDHILLQIFMIFGNYYLMRLLLYKILNK